MSYQSNHSHSVPTTPIQYQPLPFSTNHSHSVPTTPIQYQPLPFSTNHSHSVPITPIQYQPLPFSISKGCNHRHTRPCLVNILTALADRLSCDGSLVWPDPVLRRPSLSPLISFSAFLDSLKKIPQNHWLPLTCSISQETFLHQIYYCKKQVLNTCCLFCSSSIIAASKKIFTNVAVWRYVQQHNHFNQYPQLRENGTNFNHILRKQNTNGETSRPYPSIAVE